MLIFFKILFNFFCFDAWILYPMRNQMKTTCGLDTISKTRVVFI